MKSNNKIKAAVVIFASISILCALPAPAQAVVGSSDTIQYLKKNIFSFLPQELLDLVGDDGEIRLENLLAGIYKRSASTAPQNDRTVGSEASNLSQDALEAAFKANSVVHRSNVDNFLKLSPQIESVAADNETTSNSSLEAADKANKLASAGLMFGQKHIKSTNDLTQAMQVANLAQIKKGQQERVERVRAEISTNYYANELDRIRASVNNRFYLPQGGQ
jgi:hypothetical protein